MKIGFLTNHISFGGTEVALYDYAHFNEIILKNISIILTRDLTSTHKEIYDKFQNRFPVLFIKNKKDIDDIILNNKIDVLYIIKSGEDDWYITHKCKTIVHCVFTTRHPHGTIYCAISETLNKIHNTNVPVLPHMIYVDNNTSETFHKQLNIPEDAIVIGRYGSYDSFDISFVQSAVIDIVNQIPNIYFIFMNTKTFGVHKNIHYLPCTIDLSVKRKFINTCNVMLHARYRGETFGLSCGEFAICGKPIITYGLSHERAHIDILKDKCLRYNDKKMLIDIIKNKKWNEIDMSNNGYIKYTPDNVIQIFKQLL
jgi:hypothetical protein